MFGWNIIVWLVKMNGQFFLCTIIVLEKSWEIKSCKLIVKFWYVQKSLNCEQYKKPENYFRLRNYNGQKIVIKTIVPPKSGD